MWIRSLFLSALLVAAAATATNAASTLTARSSGGQSVKIGPGSSYPTIDMLADQERVYVTRCLRQQTWCRIKQLDGGPAGWVMGSYLIGSPAKLAVTPFEFSFDPMDPLGLFDHDDD